MVLKNLLNGLALSAQHSLFVIVHGSLATAFALPVAVDNIEIEHGYAQPVPDADDYDDSGFYGDMSCLNRSDIRPA